MEVGAFIVIAGDYNFGTLNNESEDCPTLSLALMVVADICSDKDKIIRILFYLCFIYIKSRTYSIHFIHYIHLIYKHNILTIQLLLSIFRIFNFICLFCIDDFKI